jgi:hypothetical protein
MRLKINNIYIVLLLLVPFFGTSQKASNFQFDIGLYQNYKGFFKLFDGVVEAGAGYNMELIKNLYGGAAFRMGLLGRKGTSSRTAIYKPGLNLHYYVHLSEKLALVPLASISYAFLNISNKEYKYRELQRGWSPGAELRMLWKREKKMDFYVFGRFDYIYLDEDKDFTQLEYYRQVWLSAFGLGLRLKSARK